MTIIFFYGLGSSKKVINYIYNGKIYNKNNFIKLSEKLILYLFLKFHILMFIIIANIHL